jgi:serine/threonine protein kinase
MSYSASPDPMPLSAGSVVAGKYRLQRLLAEGAMGMVVEATHLQLDRRVALKFMRASIVEHPVAVSRFLREARAAARIQSDYVARVFDVDTLDDGSPYLVMEYLEGEDLESLLQRSGALPLEQVVDYAIQACFGLAEAHARGVVHRDLKPANLFLARLSDGSVRVKLLDFGISKLIPVGGVADVAMTCTQAVMGTPLYMSPEQLRSSTNVDPRTDLWSMGVILYEMIRGAPPFDGDSLAEVCARIMTDRPPPLALGTEGLAAVIMRCLEKEAARRFSDAGALARALAPFGSSEERATAGRIPTEASTSFGSFHSSRPGTHSSLHAFVGGLAVVATIALGVVVMRQDPSEIAPRAASSPATAPRTARPTPPVPVVVPSVAPSASAAAVYEPPETTATTAAASTSLPTPRPRPRWRPAPVAAAAQSPVRTAPRSRTDEFGGRD